MRRKERLGLAYVILNNWGWDDFIGEKPDGFDNMPYWDKDGKNPQTREYYICPKMSEIKEEIGEAACSRYWWKFALKKGFIPWFIWYYTVRNRL